MKLFRKWNRIIHRDLGYFFFGMTIIYALSGIALNHKSDWNPDLIVSIEEISTTAELKDKDELSETQVLNIMKELKIDETLYKRHILTKNELLKILLTDKTSIFINPVNGKGEVEKKRNRPVFKEVNFLHYNPIRTWTYFSDFFAGSLILLAVSGLFLIRGKNGITGRGAWLTTAGLLTPIIYLLIYYYKLF